MIKASLAGQYYLYIIIEEVVQIKMELLSSLKKGNSKPEVGVLMGKCSVNHYLLQDYLKNVNNLLPEASILVVFAVAHSTSALDTDNVQIKQYDTQYTYNRVGALSHQLTREIEAEGCKAVAVPAFLPIDMLGKGKGMRGEICWRRAAVAAGLGFWGKNGLLVTGEYGPRVRIGGVLTNYPFPGDSNLEEHGGDSKNCGDCTACLEGCPAGALASGSINKKYCGDVLFEYGLRRYMHFLEELGSGSEEKVQEMVKRPEARELWQTLITGSYYYCWKCQSLCPRGRN